MWMGLLNSALRGVNVFRGNVLRPARPPSLHTFSTTSRSVRRGTSDTTPKRAARAGGKRVFFLMIREICLCRAGGLVGGSRSGVGRLAPHAGCHNPHFDGTCYSVMRCEKKTYKERPTRAAAGPAPRWRDGPGPSRLGPAQNGRFTPAAKAVSSSKSSPTRSWSSAVMRTPGMARSSAPRRSGREKSVSLSPRALTLVKQSIAPA